MDTIISMILSIAVVVALGLSVYNYMSVASMKRAVGVHNTLLDLAEFKNLDPALKSYYVNVVKDVMPEVMDYANIAWATVPAEQRALVLDPATTQRAAAKLRAGKPQFKAFVENNMNRRMTIPSLTTLMPMKPTSAPVKLIAAAPTAKK